MNLLLDTQILLWAASAPERLPGPMQSMIEDPGNRLHFSAVSIWEVAIKSGLHRTGFSIDPRLLRRGLLEHEYVELPVLGNHACAVDLLPQIHNDPFDRMLIAQSRIEGLTLYTADAKLGGYAGPIVVI